MNDNNNAVKSNLKILIIDDSHIIVQRLMALLKDMLTPVEIRAGFDYDDGITLMNDSRFDFAIIDINLPGKSGMDFLRYLKEKQLPVGKIVMITDDPSEEKKERCLLLGADHFLNKFTDFERIPQIIAGV